MMMSVVGKRMSKVEEEEEIDPFLFLEEEFKEEEAEFEFEMVEKEDKFDDEMEENEEEEEEEESEMEEEDEEEEEKEEKFEMVEKEEVLGKNPNPLNVYVWIKINDYQAIEILWKQKNSSKHHINTTTQEHQILYGKPSSVEGKTMGQLWKISTMK